MPRARTTLLDMFKHILVPTDGSAVAAHGVKAGVRLARALGAKMTAVYVRPPYLPPLYAEAAVAVVPGYAVEDHERITKKEAAKALTAVARTATAARVRCATVDATHIHAWEAILKAAKEHKCDAIVMSSHGRGGLSRVLLGSETARVLAHATIPVLVTH